MTALVLSIGLLGAAILQTKSAKLANKAKYASSAAVLANELASAMYANPIELTAGTAGAYFLIIRNSKQGDLNLNCSEAPCFSISGESNWWEQENISGRDCRSHSCWPMEQAIFDIIQVNQKVSTQLPGGRLGSITHDGTTYTITIQWDDPNSSVTPSTSVDVPYTTAGFNLATRVRQTPYSLYFNVDEDDPDESTPAATTLGTTTSVPSEILEPWLYYLSHWLKNIRIPVPERGNYTRYIASSLVDQIDGYYINNNLLASICLDHSLQDNGICTQSFPATIDPVVDPQATTSVGDVIAPAEGIGVQLNPLTPQGRATIVEEYPLPPSPRTDGGWSPWYRDYPSDKNRNIVYAGFSGLWIWDLFNRPNPDNCGRYVRYCNNPPPFAGGKDCVGESTTCFSHGCPIVGSRLEPVFGKYGTCTCKLFGWFNTEQYAFTTLSGLCPTFCTRGEGQPFLMGYRLVNEYQTPDC